MFAATRRLRGSPRWAVATSDVETGAFEHFACALGVKLTDQTAPAVARLLDRADTAGVVDPVKEFYRAPRPYIGSAAPICQARTAAPRRQRRLSVRPCRERMDGGADPGGTRAGPGDRDPRRGGAPLAKAGWSAARTA